MVRATGGNAGGLDKKRGNRRRPMTVYSHLRAAEAVLLFLTAAATVHAQSTTTLTSRMAVVPFVCSVDFNFPAGTSVSQTLCVVPPRRILVIETVTTATHLAYGSALRRTTLEVTTAGTTASHVVETSLAGPYSSPLIWNGTRSVRCGHERPGASRRAVCERRELEQRDDFGVSTSVAISRQWIEAGR